MLLEVIILLPIVVGVVLLYWGSQLSEDHVFLKFFFQMLQPPLWFLSLHLAVISVGEVYPALVELIESLAFFTEILGYFLWILGAYIMIYLVVMQVKSLLAQVKQKREAKYG